MAQLAVCSILFKSVLPENSMQHIAEVLSSKRIEDLTGLRLCLSLMDEIR